VNNKKIKSFQVIQDPRGLFMSKSQVSDPMAAISTDRVVEIARRFCSVKLPEGKEGPLAELLRDLEFCQMWILRNQNKV
jgi:hypothetical protein